MQITTRRTLLAVALLCPAVTEALAAQGAATNPPLLGANAEVRFSLAVDPQGGPRVPAGADAVAFDRAGRLHVLDRQNAAIYVYRPDGGFARRLDLGAVVEAPLQMTVTSDDRIVVSDAGRKVFISIDPRDPRRSTVHPFPGVTLSGSLWAHPDGGVVSQGRPLSEADLVAGGIPPARLLWFRLDGRPEVSLHTFSSTPGPRGARNPLTPGPLVAPLPGGAAVADPAVYRLQVVGSGRTRDIVRNVAARRPDAKDRLWAERQAACVRMFTVGPGGRGGAAFPGGATPSLDVPERMPVLRALGVAPDGRIWVERTPADPDRPGAVDVFGGDGRLHGSVEGVGVPRAWAADGETAAFVTRDAQCRTTIQVRRVRVAAP